MSGTHSNNSVCGAQAEQIAGFQPAKNYLQHEHPTKTDVHAVYDSKSAVHDKAQHKFSGSDILSTSKENNKTKTIKQT